MALASGNSLFRNRNGRYGRFFFTDFSRIFVPQVVVVTFGGFFFTDVSRFFVFKKVLGSFFKISEKKTQDNHW